MALRGLVSSFGLRSDRTLQSLYAQSNRHLQTSSVLSRELTEGTPTTRQTTSGFERLKQGVTNLVTRQQDTSEIDQEKNVDREKSPEGHPFPEERRGSIYVKAQWQDGGVIHDVKPHGQGICLSNTGYSQTMSRMQGEKDLASA